MHVDPAVAEGADCLINIYSILLIRSNPSRQHSKVLYCWEVKTGKRTEVGVRRKIEVFEMMCLRNIIGIRRVDRVRNAIIRERCGCELSVLKE